MSKKILALFWLLLVLSTMAVSAVIDPANNTKESAKLIFVNDTILDAKFNSPGDVLWFVFYAKKGELLDINISEVGNGIDPVMTLYSDQLQIQVGEHDGGFAGQGELLSWATGAPADGFYFIEVYNKLKTSSNDSNFQIGVFSTLAPETGILKGTVTDSCSGATLGGAKLIDLNYGEHAVSYKDGEYGLPLRAESGGRAYRIDSVATGYQRQTVSLTIFPGATATKDFTLTPVNGCLQACVFNWLEAKYPQYYAPANSNWLVYEKNTYRYYKQTDSLLVFDPTNGHIYGGYPGVSGYIYYDGGLLTDRKSATGCQ